MKDKQHIVVTLIGSTNPEWKEQYAEVNRKLTLAGYVVISVAIFRGTTINIENYRPALESIHYQKIRMADVVVLIHKDAVGKHTRLEMDYCQKIRKPIVVFTTCAQAVKGIDALTFKG